jgi:hypothetical protein
VANKSDGCEVAAADDDGLSSWIGFSRGTRNIGCVLRSDTPKAGSGDRYLRLRLSPQMRNEAGLGAAAQGLTGHGWAPDPRPNWLPFLAAEAAIDHNSFVGTLVESSDA